MAISYTKLRDDSWGIRATEALTVGQVVTVTKKSGETKTETVSAVVWAGNGVWLCAVVPTAKPAPSTASGVQPRASKPQYWRPCGYPGCNPSHCDECEGQGHGGGRRRWG